MSLIESFANVLVGLLVSLASQLVIFQMYGIHISLDDNIRITLWFTLISIVRSYALRRFFTNLHRGFER